MFQDTSLKANCKLNSLGDLSSLNGVVLLNDLGTSVLHESKRAFHGHIFQSNNYN
jgi:hypothetical protein